MFTLKQLINLTPLEIRKRAGQVILYPLRAVVDIDSQNKPHRKFILKARDTKTKGETKILTFRLYGGNDDALNDKTWCHCSCEYFTYNLEVALFVEDSSSIINSNGDFPAEKNPAMRGHLCKHLLKAVNYIRQTPVKIDAAFLSGPEPTDGDIKREMKKMFTTRKK